MQVPNYVILWESLFEYFESHEDMEHLLRTVLQQVPGARQVIGEILQQQMLKAYEEAIEYGDGETVARIRAAHEGLFGEPPILS